MTSTPPDCYINLVEDPPKSIYAYFSLPHSFEHSHRKLDQNPLLLSLSSGHLAFGDTLASSTSSDSLMGQGHSSQPVVKSKRADVDSRLARPTRLSLEGNKASTLPCTHECPFPTDPKSPGEYVNIEFNDKAFSADLATHFSPVFPGSGPEKPAEISSDYMNMHLGAQGRGIPNWEAKPLASCTDCYAIVAPVAPSSSVIPCENLCRRDYSSTQTDYSDTHMILNAPMSTIDASPFSVSPPSQDLSVLGAGPSAVPLGLMGPLSGLSAFTRVNSSFIWNQGAKLIRADQQGRRRHSSETFSTGVPVSAAAPSVEEVKRHSSASFENVWLKPGESPLSANSRRESPLAPSSNGQNQNRLNYIDLDLAQDQNLPEWSSLPARAMDTQGGSAPEDLRAYASISFQKAGESRMNPAHREGKTVRSP
jgi:insulin receptor substrate 1